MRITSGATYIRSNFDKLSRSARDGILGLVKETAEAVAQEYRDTVRGGGRSGRVYGGHQASAPGEPPATLTGELADSVETDFSGKGIGVVRVKHPASRILEFGGKRFAARPAMRPIMERRAQEYEQKAAAIIQAASAESEI